MSLSFSFKCEEAKLNPFTWWLCAECFCNDDVDDGDDRADVDCGGGWFLKKQNLGSKNRGSYPLDTTTSATSSGGKNISAADSLLLFFPEALDVIDWFYVERIK